MSPELPLFLELCSKNMIGSSSTWQRVSHLLMHITFYLPVAPITLCLSQKDPMTQEEIEDLVLKLNKIELRGAGGA